MHTVAFNKLGQTQMLNVLDIRLLYYAVLFTNTIANRCKQVKEILAVPY